MFISSRIKLSDKAMLDGLKSEYKIKVNEKKNHPNNFTKKMAKGKNK